MLIDRYDWAGGSEAMLRFGPATGPTVIAALPLFEEANRTRSFVIDLLRRLAERGIASALPDLPGTGESEVVTQALDLARLQSAFNSAVEALGGNARPVYAMAVRSGALVSANAAVFGHWTFAAQRGNALIRELGRVGGFGKDPDWWCRPETVLIAGNRISTALTSALISARPFEDRLRRPLRSVRYQSDPEPADRKVAGAPLWRRVEPGEDSGLAQILADDIADWIATCGA